jgi:predicted lipoprotein with Yx(FWY)xxD motif
MSHRPFHPLVIALLLGGPAAVALAGCTKSSGSVSTAYAAEPTLLTGANGMTLYVSDKDQDGEPACYAKCALNWPPYLGTEGEQKPAKWQLVQRTDGTAQWAYEGRPVYYFKGDKAEGDTNGDGKDGVWHIIYKS